MTDILWEIRVEYAFETALVVCFTLFLTRLTGRLELLLTSAMLYFWSLWGVLTLSKPDISPVTTATIEQIIRFQPNEHYLVSLRLYTMFIVVALFVLAALPRPERLQPGTEIALSPVRLTVFAALSTGLLLFSSAYLVRQGLATGVSGYLASAQTQGGFRSLVNLATGFAFSALVLLYCSSERAQYPRMTSLMLGLGVPALLLGNFLLGSRSTPLAGILTGAVTIYYFGARTDARKLILGAISACLLVLVLALSAAFRGHQVNEIGEFIHSTDAQRLFEIFQAANTGEGVAAHLSMYAVLQTHQDVIGAPLLLTLPASLVPVSAMPQGLVPTTYSRYASALGVDPTVGVTMHLATSFYLLAGVPGVLFGGCLLGLTIARASHLFVSLIPRQQPDPLVRMMLLAGQAGMIGYLPHILRASFDGAKGYLQFGVLMPMFLLLVSYTGRARPATRA